MRMIDADKLIEKLRDFKEWENDDGRPIHTMSETQRIDRCINFAQTEPTAFDADKVVKEINEWTFNANIDVGDGTVMNHNLIVRDTAIEIVKQEAEKFGTDINVVSNGWIPCSERLPEESGYYLVTYHNWSDGNFLPKYNDTYVRRLHYQISEHFVGWNYPKNVDDRAENDCHKEVIAWQPLPEPYKGRE